MLTKSQITDRSVQKFCIRCSIIDENKSNFVFTHCLIFKSDSKTCENCFFKHKTHECNHNQFIFLLFLDFRLIYYINFMRKKFAIVKMMFSIFVTRERFSNARLKIKIFVKNCENDVLMRNVFFSRRAFKRQRLMMILRLFQSFVIRRRFKSND